MAFNTDANSPYSPPPTPTPPRMIYGHVPMITRAQLRAVSPASDIDEIRQCTDPNLRLAALVCRGVYSDQLHRNPVAPDVLLAEIQRALSDGANPNSFIDFNMPSATSSLRPPTTLLQTHLRTGAPNPAIIRLLVEAGADPNFDLSQRDAVQSPRETIERSKQLETAHHDAAQNWINYVHELQAYITRVKSGRAVPGQRHTPPSQIPALEERLRVAQLKVPEAQAALDAADAKLAVCEEVLGIMENFQGTPLKDQLAQWRNPSSVSPSPNGSAPDQPQPPRTNQHEECGFFGRLFGTCDSDHVSDASDQLSAPPRVFAAVKSTTTPTRNS